MRNENQNGNYMVSKIHDDEKFYSVKLKVKDHDELVKIFNDLGLDWQTGINIYLRQVLKKKRIPFDLNTNAPSRYNQSVNKQRRSNNAK